MIVQNIYPRFLPVVMDFVAANNDFCYIGNIFNSKDTDVSGNGQTVDRFTHYQSVTGRREIKPLDLRNIISLRGQLVTHAWGKFGLYSASTHQKGKLKGKGFGARWQMQDRPHAANNVYVLLWGLGLSCKLGS